MRTTYSRKIIEMLQGHLPELIQRTLRKRPECFNILSIGSGPGKTDLDALKIIKQELNKREHGRQMKLLNGVIEPNEYRLF